MKVTTSLLQSKWLRCVLVLAAIWFAFTLNVEADEQAQQWPELTEEVIAKAEAGDPYHAYVYVVYLMNSAGAADYEKALEILPYMREGYATGNEVDEMTHAWGHVLTGRAHTQLSQFSAALRSFETADSIYSNYPANQIARTERARIAQDIGMTLQQLSRYEDSLPLFQRARNAFIELEGKDSSQIPDTHLNEGISLEGMERYEDSILSYRAAMFGYETHLGKGSAPVGYAINNIAWVYRRQNDFATSEDWFLRALPIIEKHEGAQSPNATKVRINLGIVTLEQDRPDDAIRWTMRAMPFMISNRASTYSDQRWAFETLSQAMRKKGDIDKAIAFGKLAVNAQQAIRANNADLEKGETKDLRAEWARLYESLASLLIEQGRITEAQAVLNMEKEEEVYNFLRRDASADITKTSALLNDTEVQTSERLESAVALPVAASQKLFELTSLVETDTATDADIEQFFELQEVLETANREFDARVEAFLQEVTADDEDHAFSSQLENVGSQQTNLLAYDRPTALLQVAALPDKTHLFLTLPDLSFYFEVAKDRAELSKLIVDTLQAIDGRAPTINANLKELYDVVFAPAHDALKEAEIEVVMLNLNGVLRYVPFAALYDGERYLVEDFAFSLYSPAYATQFNTGAREVTKTAGFGVTREHPGFDPLPGVGLELETIFAGEDADGILAGPTVLDDEFDVKQLKLTLIKRPEILHIASHFHLQPGREDDSFLLMGDGSRLKLSDIRTTKALSFRGIDLVTLSACQTALGSHDGSEIEGFAAAAQSNGARSVMATLWPVADDATPELMRDFYDGMFNANRTKADALRDAQLAMLHSVERTEAVKVAARGASSRQKKKAEAESFAGFSHPYFWSPFVLMGNWL